MSGKSNMYYFDICSMDYNSKIIDMNKPIDKSKIIHSNNFYSFLVSLSVVGFIPPADIIIIPQWGRFVNTFLKNN